MKKIVLAFFALILCLGAFSQNQQTNNAFPKTIAVEGSAEMEIVPDEIYAKIELKEYDKKGVGKQTLEKIKTDFLAACRNIGISDSSISIDTYAGMSSYPWWKKKRRRDDFDNSITYQIRFSSGAKIDELLEKLDDDATQNFSIDRTSHSKIREYRQTLKIQAVKAAKEKAILLAEAIDEKIGVAVTIIEPADILAYNDVRQISQRSNLAASNAFINFNDDKGSQVEFKKIKLRYTANVVFALK